MNRPKPAIDKIILEVNTESVIPIWKWPKNAYSFFLICRNGNMGRYRRKQ